MTDTCKAPGCTKRAVHVGECVAHYRRRLKTGGYEITRAAPGAPLKWLIAHAWHEGDDCLPWPFGSAETYSAVWLGGRFTKAHRVMCELRNGPPDDSMMARHTCGNARCVNPNHLIWGTATENSADRAAHGTDLKGSASPVAKLTEDQVLEIRRRRDSGEKIDDLAAEFGVSRSNIGLIGQRKTWTHLKEEA